MVWYNMKIQGSLFKIINFKEVTREYWTKYESFWPQKYVWLNKSNTHKTNPDWNIFIE